MRIPLLLLLPTAALAVSTTTITEIVATVYVGAGTVLEPTQPQEKDQTTTSIISSTTITTTTTTVQPPAVIITSTSTSASRPWAQWSGWGGFIGRVPGVVDPEYEGGSDIHEKDQTTTSTSSTTTTTTTTTSMRYLQNNIASSAPTASSGDLAPYGPSDTSCTSESKRSVGEGASIALTTIIVPEGASTSIALTTMTRYTTVSAASTLCPSDAAYSCVTGYTTLSTKTEANDATSLSDVSRSKSTSTSTSLTTSTGFDSLLTTMSMEYMTTMTMFQYTGSSSTTPTPIALATYRPLPSAGTQLNGTVLETCLSEPGGVGAQDGATIGCGSLFAHVETCYDAMGPWDSPYNQTKNLAFQACFCETTATTAFTRQSVLYQNFTDCTDCLLSSGSGLDLSLLLSEGQRIEEFCCSQNPNAFLALSGFEQWLQALLQDAGVTHVPFSGAVTQLTTLLTEFTTVPPLANLAYGASAPADGSLMGVKPAMTTFTTSGTIMEANSEMYTGVQTVTELLSWVPTASSAGYEASSAGASASEAALGNLKSALSSLQAQGGPSKNCIGPCPSSAAASRGLSRGTIILAFGVVMAMFMMGSCA